MSMPTTLSPMSLEDSAASFFNSGNLYCIECCNDATIDNNNKNDASSPSAAAVASLTNSPVFASRNFIRGRHAITTANSIMSIDLTSCDTPFQNGGIVTPSCPIVGASSSSISSPTSYTNDSSNNNIVRTTLIVQGICCATEVPIVKQIVKNLAKRIIVARSAATAGVSDDIKQMIVSIHINIATKNVYIQHSEQSISSHDIANELTVNGFSTKIISSKPINIVPSATATSASSAPTITTPTRANNNNDILSNNAKIAVSPIFGNSNSQNFDDNNNNSNDNNNGTIGISTFQITIRSKSSNDYKNPNVSSSSALEGISSIQQRQLEQILQSNCTGYITITDFHQHFDPNLQEDIPNNDVNSNNYDHPQHQNGTLSTTTSSMVVVTTTVSIRHETIQSNSIYLQDILQRTYVSCFNMTENNDSTNTSNIGNTTINNDNNKIATTFNNSDKNAINNYINNDDKTIDDNLFSVHVSIQQDAQIIIASNIADRLLMQEKHQQQQMMRQRRRLHQQQHKQQQFRRDVDTATTVSSDDDSDTYDEEDEEDRYSNDTRSLLDRNTKSNDDAGSNEDIVGPPTALTAGSVTNDDQLLISKLDKGDGMTSSSSSFDEVSTLKLNVALSGIFWVIALISAIVEHDTVSMFSGLLSVLFGLPPVAKKAYRTLFYRYQFDSNCMMFTAAIGAVLLKEFEEASSVAFLFALSEYLERIASTRARNALHEIVSLRPNHAYVIHPITNEAIIVHSDNVPIGSYISVRTGDIIAADGIVVEGTSSIDQSSLTGESVPVHVSVGSTVQGGCINVGTVQLIVRTTQHVQDSAVCRLIRLVEEGQSNHTPTEKLIDTFARAYTPIILSLAILMSTIPWIFGPDIGRYWTLNGLIIIVIACPCALTISTPITYAAALAACAKRGVIVKGGTTLEGMGNIGTVVFDKTGTITEGKFIVSDIETIGTAYPRNDMLALLSLIESPSSHPLSSTLVHAAKREGISIPYNMRMMNHTILKGEGVTACINDQNVYVGNKRLFERVGMYHQLSINDKNRTKRWDDDGGTVGFIGIDEIGIIGCYNMTDTIRCEAKETIMAFQNMGKNVLMLTGDGIGPACAVAKQVGIARNSVHATLLPEDKLSFVTKLKQDQEEIGDEASSCSNMSFVFRNICQKSPLPKKSSNVLFCGDGVNDAPALAYADIGVSMGQGSALALEISDVTLMDSNLTKLLYIVELGSRVVQTIRENILLSFVCKVIVIALTFGGHMTLLFAIASDVGVMLLVTLNGMKLLPSSSLPAANTNSSRSWDTTATNPISYLQSKRANDYDPLVTALDAENQRGAVNESALRQQGTERPTDTSITRNGGEK